MSLTLSFFDLLSWFSWLLPQCRHINRHHSRYLAFLLLRTFAPLKWKFELWIFCCWEQQFRGTFSRWNFCSLQLSLLGAKLLNFHSLEHSLPGTFILGLSESYMEYLRISLGVRAWRPRSAAAVVAFECCTGSFYSPKFDRSNEVNNPIVAVSLE